MVDKLQRDGSWLNVGGLSFSWSVPAGLTMHASILAYMFNLVEEGKITTTLNPANPATNQVFIQEYVANLLKTAFPHLQEWVLTNPAAVPQCFLLLNTSVSVSAQVKVFVTGLFSLNQDIPAFKEHLRDFLVQIKVSWLQTICLDSFMCSSCPDRK